MHDKMFKATHEEYVRCAEHPNIHHRQHQVDYQPKKIGWSENTNVPLFKLLHTSESAPDLQLENTDTKRLTFKCSCKSIRFTQSKLFGGALMKESQKKFNKEMMMPNNNYDLVDQKLDDFSKTYSSFGGAIGNVSPSTFKNMASKSLI